jgi:hypothetical protein
VSDLAELLIECGRNEDGWWRLEVFTRDPDSDAFYFATGAISQGRTLRSAARNVIAAYVDIGGHAVEGTNRA